MNEVYGDVILSSMSVTQDWLLNCHCSELRTMGIQFLSCHARLRNKSTALSRPLRAVRIHQLEATLVLSGDRSLHPPLPQPSTKNSSVQDLLHVQIVIHKFSPIKFSSFGLNWRTMEFDDKSYNDTREVHAWRLKPVKQYI